jgi:hypothetical protein
LFGLCLCKQSITGERVYALYDGGERSNGTRRELAAVIYTHERAPAGMINEPKMVRARKQTNKQSSPRALSITQVAEESSPHESVPCLSTRTLAFSAALCSCWCLCRRWRCRRWTGSPRRAAPRCSARTGPATGAGAGLRGSWPGATTRCGGSSPSRDTRAPRTSSAPTPSPCSTKP